MKSADYLDLDNLSNCLSCHSMSEFTSKSEKYDFYIVCYMEDWY